MGVNKGWVAVGLVLLVSSLAGFQTINSSAYAQTTENDTLNTSPLSDLPSNLLQSQLEPDQDSLIVTPGLSDDDLNPNTDETIENSIVQDRLPQGRAALAPDQPGTDVNDDQDTPNSDDQDQQGNEQDDESNDNGNDDAEEEENDQDDTTDENDRTNEIPSSLRMHEDIVPFP
jgi:hypothetical protein